MIKKKALRFISQEINRFCPQQDNPEECIKKLILSMDVIYEKLYCEAIVEFDADDNGIEIKSKLKDKDFFYQNHLIGLVGRLNGDNIKDEEVQMKNFRSAMDIFRVLCFIYFSFW